MGQARELMDRMTQALTSDDLETAGQCYAEDAVAETPELGTLRGRGEIINYLKQFAEGFPDLTYEYLEKHDTDTAAIDEGFVVGTHSGAFATSTGEMVQPTGKKIRVRSCDVAVVKDGHIVEHRFYYDQMQFAQQLGLME